MDSKSSSFNNIAPPVFDGVNYQMWAVKMEAYLEAIDVWEAVEQDYEVPQLQANPTMAQIKLHKEKKQRKSKAKACLFASVSAAIFSRIMTLQSAHSIWVFLKKEYEGDERIKSMQVLNLVREFEMKRMKDSETIKEYVDKLVGIANKIRLLKADMPDSRIMQKILVTVPEKFEATITSLENSKDIASITLAELLNALQAQEQRRLMRQEDSVEGALLTKHMSGNQNKSKIWFEKKKSTAETAANESVNNKYSTKKEYPPCKHCGKKGHPPYRCWKRPDVRCVKCNKLGHHVKLCRNKDQQQTEAHVADEKEEEEQLFVATCFAGNNSSEGWLIDSGCTHHMTYDEKLFKDLDKTAISKVKVGNGSYIQVKGRGTVALETNSGTKVITDVLFVPEIDTNLLSVGQLLEKGLKVLFEGKTCLIKDTSDREIFRIKIKKNSFILDLLNEDETAYSCQHNATELWHKRLGHFNHRALLLMKENDMVYGLSNLEEQQFDCPAYHLGKQTKLPFKQTTWRASKKLQLIHSDLCGPQPEPSLNGSRYYMIFIDDLTRMCWIYFLKHKSEAVNGFLRFKAWIENQSSCKIQVLRTDNGTEYTSTQFSHYLEVAGIEHQLTAPYTPQQNGVSERKNMTIMEMVRCMLNEMNLPKVFWAEAASTTVFLLNRISTKAVKDKTPFEAWFGLKPSFLNLKVFGCLCFVYIPQVKRDKLDKKSEAGIFIGYSNVSKAYRVYQPQTKRILVSRDVHFVENQFWNWKIKQQDAKPDNQIESDDNVDDQPIRGTRLLSDIYQRCNVAILEPSSYQEAEKDPKWRGAMKEEMMMIERNQTWELTERPEDRKVIGVKWVYRTKLNSDGSVNKYKARLVVKGFAQIPGIDFSETFAPVARLDTIRLLIALAAQNSWNIFQLDVKSAFLNGFLQEEIYVEQPEGFTVSGHEDKVLRLKKALYGLKQAPRAWYSRVDEHLLNLGFEKSPSEYTLYVKRCKTDITVVSVYVDDLLVTGNNIHLINKFKQQMMTAFEMTDLGVMSYFLGMEIKQHKENTFICQQKYAKEILKKFHMEDCKPINTPMNQKEKLLKEDGTQKQDETEFRSLIGCLMYLTATRPDILQAVNVLSRFMNQPTVLHFKAAKRILRYIKGTVNYGMKFTTCHKLNFHGYSDSDWGGCVNDFKSTSGYCFSLGSGFFSWNSKKQEIVAQSTAEAEFVAATAAANQAIWLRKLLEDLDEKQTEATQIFVDNQSAIAIAANPVFHGKTKHFNIKLYFLRDAQKNGEVKLQFCRTEEQFADLFTKPLPPAKFEKLRGQLGVCSSEVKEEC